MRVYASTMYVSVSRLRVDGAKAPELVDAFRRRACLVDAFEGFIRLEVWQSERDEGEILMVSHWDSRESFKRYMRSDAHQVSHDRIGAELADAIELERLEHVQSYEVVAT